MKMPVKRKLVCINGKNFRLSRLLMTIQLGRSLSGNEVVHHIDGDPTNDTIDNLQVMSRGEHSRLHHSGKRRKLRDMLIKHNLLLACAHPERLCWKLKQARMKCQS